MYFYITPLMKELMIFDFKTLDKCLPQSILIHMSHLRSLKFKIQMYLK